MARRKATLDAAGGDRRCPWATGEAMIRYHDREWGVPLHNDRRLFELLILEGAQAGLSWSTILARRENYRRAFDGFDPARVAAYKARAISRLLSDRGIVRNRLKVQAAVLNARALLNVRKEFGSFDDFVWRFTGGRTRMNSWRSPGQVPATTAESEAMSRELRRRGFKFVGPTICYAFMQSAGMVNDHLVGCFRYAELRSRG